jgi:hypothetical protein
MRLLCVLCVGVYFPYPGLAEGMLWDGQEMHTQAMVQSAEVPVSRSPTLVHDTFQILARTKDMYAKSKYSVNSHDRATDGLALSLGLTTAIRVS